MPNLTFWKLPNMLVFWLTMIVFKITQLNCCKLHAIATLPEWRCQLMISTATFGNMCKLSPGRSKECRDHTTLTPFSFILFSCPCSSIAGWFCVKGTQSILMKGMSSKVKNTFFLQSRTQREGGSEGVMSWRHKMSKLFHLYLIDSSFTKLTQRK